MRYIVFQNGILLHTTSCNGGGFPPKFEEMNPLLAAVKMQNWKDHFWNLWWQQNTCSVNIYRDSVPCDGTGFYMLIRKRLQRLKFKEDTCTPIHIMKGDNFLWCTGSHMLLTFSFDAVTSSSCKGKKRNTSLSAMHAKIIGILLIQGQYCLTFEPLHSALLRFRSDLVLRFCIRWGSDEDWTSLDDLIIELPLMHTFLLVSAIPWCGLETPKKQFNQQPYQKIWKKMLNTFNHTQTMAGSSLCHMQCSSFSRRSHSGMKSLEETSEMACIFNRYGWHA